MSTKYDVSASMQWSLRDDNPSLSGHILPRGENRWGERTPWWSVSPETAWERGVPLDGAEKFFEDSGGQIPDNARYYEGHRDGEWFGVVFIVVENVVVTIYDWDRIHSQATQAFLREKWREHNE